MRKFASVKINLEKINHLKVGRYILENMWEIL